MTSLINAFAEWFKDKKVPIRYWYDDAVGDYAFRVRVEGATFVCAARSSGGDRTSCMLRVAKDAARRDALIALRLGDTPYVFDPITVLNHGNHDNPYDDKRSKRGEKWVYFDVDLGCRFDNWFDGYDDPVRYADVGDF